MDVAKVLKRLNGGPVRVAAASAATAILAYGIVRALKKSKPRSKDRDKEKEPAKAADGKAIVEKGKKKKKSSNSLPALLKLLFPYIGSKSFQRLVSLGLLCIVQTYVNDKTALLQGDIFKAIFTRNRGDFLNLMSKNVVYHVGVSFLHSTIEYCKELLSINLREMLYESLHSDYFRSMAYYKMSFVDKRITSPEEVLSSDVQRFAATLSDIAVDVLSAIFNGAYFTYRLAKATSGKWSMVSWLYVTTTIVVIQALSPNFGKLYATRLNLDESFRQSVARLHTHSEAVAALGGDDREKTIIFSRFQELYRHIQRVIKTQWWFGMVEDFIAKYCASTVAMIVILGPFFSGRLKSDGSSLGNANTLSTMRYVTSVIIHQLTAIGGLAISLRKVSKLAGYADRVQEFRSVLTDIHKSIAEDHHESIEDGEHIEFRDVEVVTPAGQSLVKALNFAIRPGSNLIITGPNGAGKSSIFRCLGSLWKIKSGKIIKPKGADGLCGDVFYLPQKPYNVVGSLRDQLTYPITNADKLKSHLTDTELRALLRLVDLEYLVDMQADAQLNWENTLSLGETQRLAMARLFYHCPKFAILDECTSAVSAAMEVRLYELCNEKGITCVTISHRPALVAFHDMKLELDGQGGFSLEALERQANVETVSINHHTTAFTRTLVNEHSAARERDLSITPLPSPIQLFKKSAASASSTFVRMLKVMVPSWTDGVVARLGGLALIVLARVALSDRIARLNGDTVKYLLFQDLSGFKKLVMISIVQCVASSIMAPSLHYVTRQLALIWRSRLQKYFIDLYFKNKSFYKVSHVYEGIDNPDQRISEDLEQLCADMANVFPDVIKPIFDITWFSYQSVQLLGARNTAFLYVYMVAGLGFLKVVIPDFGALVQRMQSLEGTFRYVQTRVRTHGESVAFFGGDAREGAIAHNHFDAVIQHSHRKAFAQWRHGILDNFVTKQLPPIVTWGLSFLFTMRVDADRSGKYDQVGAQLGHELRVVASAVSHVFLACADLLQLYKTSLELSGRIARLGELEQFLLGTELESKNQIGFGQVFDSEDLIFDQAQIVTPTGRVLVEKIDHKLQKFSNLLVTGPNTSGKSSLFRVLGGLWPLRGGRIGKPGGASKTSIKDIFLVPQKPYHVSGRLIDQLTYPVVVNSRDEAVIARLSELLEAVNLTYLLERGGWDAVANWNDVLSLGEQQRIGMARLFYHCPKYAILDQCTDAVSVDVENRLYEFAKSLGISVVTISQRPALGGHHPNELRLLGENGGWNLYHIEERK